MTTVSFAEANVMIQELQAKAKKLRPEPVYFYPYLKRVLNEQWEKLQPKFPMDIKLPKDSAHLLKGDFEPAQVIHLEEPICMEDGTPMWFESSAKQTWLRFGYTNCDARFICEQQLSSEYIHGFLGGSSGHGKSVTLNSLLGSMFYEYAPWELDVKMSDAKVIVRRAHYK